MNDRKAREILERILLRVSNLDLEKMLTAASRGGLRINQGGDLYGYRDCMMEGSDGVLRDPNPNDIVGIAILESEPDDDSPLPERSDWLQELATKAGLTDVKTDEDLIAGLRVKPNVGAKKPPLGEGDLGR